MRAELVVGDDGRLRPRSGGAGERVARLLEAVGVRGGLGAGAESPSAHVAPGSGWTVAGRERPPRRRRAGDGHERADASSPTVEQRPGQRRGERRLEPRRRRARRRARRGAARARSRVGRRVPRARLRCGPARAGRRSPPMRFRSVSRSIRRTFLIPTATWPAIARASSTRRVASATTSPRARRRRRAARTTRPRRARVESSGPSSASGIVERGARPDRVRLTQPELVSAGLDQVDVARLGLEQAARAVGRPREAAPRASRFARSPRRARSAPRARARAAACSPYSRAFSIAPATRDAAVDEEVDLVVGELARRLACARR